MADSPIMDRRLQVITDFRFYDQTGRSRPSGGAVI